MNDDPRVSGSDFPYYGPQPARIRPPRRRALVLSLIALFMAALLTVSAVLVFGGTFRLRGNAGVVAAFEYARAYIKQSRAVMDRGLAGEVSRRLGSEAFEIKCRLNIASDQLGSSIAPLTSIPVGVDVKYDMKDLGVKVSALGFEFLSAYVIGDEFAVAIGSEAGSERIDLPIEANLDAPMTLPDRFLAFLPFLSEDRLPLALRVLEAFAQSVPDEYTRTYTVHMYSPAAHRQFKTDVIETSLDSAAIIAVFDDFTARLRADKALCDDIQTLFDEVTKFFGADETDLDDLLGELEDMREADIAGASVSWEVYRRQGVYSGMSVTASSRDMGATTVLSEFCGNVFYTLTRVESDGISAESYSVTTYDGSRVEIEGVTRSGMDFMTSEMRQTGWLEYARDGADKYTAKYEMTIAQNAEYSGEFAEFIEDTTINARVRGDIDFKFGSDLKPLKETPGWRDIYEMDWGSLEDALEGFSQLGDMFGGTLGIL
jgi:hypothetical protein